MQRSVYFNTKKDLNLWLAHQAISKRKGISMSRHILNLLKKEINDMRFLVDAGILADDKEAILAGRD